MSILIALPAWFILLLNVSALVGSLAFATAVAIVARRFRYGGMPRPAEWLALLIAAGMLSRARALPDVDEAVNWSTVEFGLHGSLAGNFGLFRWAWAGVATVVALVGLATLAVGRRWLSTGVVTLVLTGVATALLWGPIPVLSLELPWMIWGPSPAAGEVPGALFSFWLEARKGIARLPLGLLVGVPVVATVRDRLQSDRPAWKWTEWVGAGTAGWFALAIVGSWLIGLLWTERLAACLWLGMVIWISHRIARRLVAPGS